MNLLQNNNLLIKIQDFEKKFNLTFPKELENYYLQKESEKFEDITFVRIIDANFHQDNILEEIMPLSELIRVYIHLQDDSTFTKAISNVKLLPFGECLGGSLLCMASSPDLKLHGKIYVWDWDFRATYQADSLADFLSQLRAYEEVLV